ncbi:hypothetical protein HELRODRAFT_164009 [Helobdella robusta]|uniref:Aminotransferase class V domain-containing protein n=1 Tax=Helobdella robusta TaxID=6412 RepID=T1EUR5_HELRO|nr:hypothetical protein HELRODRAFT_164009 [Helobdella robusta]ESN94212.1 hypothetical protein HELRODRAFT_164009 [Helobdella robusta]
MSKYGTNIRNRFLLNPDHVFLNHGSFGAAGIEPHNLRIKLIDEMECQADVWFRQKIWQTWNDNLRSVSEFVHSEPENVVFVSNTTTGIGCVMRSLKFNKGDGILMCNWTYQAVKNIVNYVKNEIGNIEVYTVTIPEDFGTSQHFVSLYEEQLRKHSNIKLVIIDYISSVPPCLMPLTELISIVKKYDKMVLVDGAHAPGQVPLDLESLGCDFFAGNLHKWCYVPRGCAVLWVDPKYHKQIFPATISRFGNDNSLSQLFYYQGTADTTQFFVSKSALDFYEDIGGHESISKYCTSLIEQSANMLVKKWNTQHFPLPDDMKAPFMRIIRLPTLAKFPITPNKENFTEDVSDIMSHLWDEFKIQTVCIKMYNKAWIRLSVNVYNTFEDYEKLGDAILSMVL